MTHKKKYKSGNMPFDIYSSSVSEGYAGIGISAPLGNTPCLADRKLLPQNLDTFNAYKGENIASQFFGTSISMVSGNVGVYTLVGAEGSSFGPALEGKAYLVHSTSAGITRETLTASDGAAGDFFGYSVSIATGSDAIYCLVGARQAANTGKAYLYKGRPDGTFAEQILTGSDTNFEDQFGRSTDIVSGADGIYCLIGAPNKGSGFNDGQAYLYHSKSSGFSIPSDEIILTSSQLNTYFGTGVALISGSDGIHCLVGASEYDAPDDYGAAHLWRIIGGSVSTHLLLTASARGVGDRLGSSVAMLSGADGIYCLAGAPYSDVEGYSNSGHGVLWHSKSSGFSMEDDQKTFIPDPSLSAGYFSRCDMVSSSAGITIFAGAPGYRTGLYTYNVGRVAIIESTPNDCAAIIKAECDDICAGGDGTIYYFENINYWDSSQYYGQGVGIALGGDGELHFVAGAPGSDYNGWAYSGFIDFYNGRMQLIGKNSYPSPGFDITNLHEDTYGGIKDAPMQGPFTYQYVGGNQHRHLPLNKGGDRPYNRPELFNINFSSSGEIKVVGQSDSSLVDMTPELIVDGDNADKIHSIAFDYIHKRMYWDLSDDSGKLVSANFDGSDQQDVGQFGADYQIALDPGAQQIYYASTSTLERVDYGGTNNVTIVTWSNIQGVTIDFENRHLYVARNTEVRRFPLGPSGMSSTEGEVIVTGLTNIKNIIFYEGILYGADYDDDIIWTSPANTLSTSFSTIESVTQPTAVAIDPIANRLFWTSWVGASDQRIYYKHLNIPNAEVVLLNGDVTESIQAGFAFNSDNNMIYYSCHGAVEKMYRMPSQDYLPTTAQYTRGEVAKRPVNIANHKTYNPLGNYTYDYEVIQTVGRTSNNRAFVRASGSGFIGDPSLPFSGTLTSQFVRPPPSVWPGETGFQNKKYYNFGEPDGMTSNCSFLSLGDPTGVGGLDFLPAGAWTISVWFKINPSANDVYSLVTKGQSAGELQYQIMLNAAGSGVAQVYCGGTLIQGSADLRDGEWHNMVLANDGGDFTLYVDGAYVADDTTAGETASGRHVLVGAGESDIPTPTFGMWGYIDEVSFWNTWFNAADVTELYNNGVPTELTTHSEYSDLVTWLRMGDGIGDTTAVIVDQEGINNATLMVSGSPIEPAPGIELLRRTESIFSQSLNPDLRPAYDNTYTRDYTLPVFGTDETVFVNRFNAPGGPDVSSRGVLDTYAEEFAPNNALPWRNNAVRSVLRSDLARHTPNASDIPPLIPTKYHTDYRNPKRKLPTPSDSIELVNTINDGGSTAIHGFSISPPTGPLPRLAQGRDLYLMETNGDEIWRMPNLPEGGTSEVIFSGVSGNGTFALLWEEGEKIYFNDAATIGGTCTLKRIDLDGSSVETMISDSLLGFTAGFAIDPSDEKIYWMETTGAPPNGNYAIKRAGLNIPDGFTFETRTDIETLVTVTGVSGGGMSLDLVNGKMYWHQYTLNYPAFGETYNNAIWRANLDGTGVEQVYIDPHVNAQIRNIEIDAPGKRIYFTVDPSQGIWSIPLQSTPLAYGFNETSGNWKYIAEKVIDTSEIPDGDIPPAGLRIDSDRHKIYWVTDSSNPTNIYRADLPELSSYDNAYVTHAIPRCSLDYSWINASALTTKYELPGYQSSGSY